ncbi:60S ribosomal protein L34 [Irineochytrium annulatum]|nr:60S ribosomal protein L34 [Irineochytrium annulatum]
MVQRVTYRRRLSYNTNSNKHRIVKTPGGKLVYQRVKKLTGAPKCGDCGDKLAGVPNLRSASYARISKRVKSVSRPYGGSRCATCVRQRIVRAFLIEEQKIVKKVLKNQQEEAKAASKPVKAKKSKNMLALLHALLIASLTPSAAGRGVHRRSPVPFGPPPPGNCAVTLTVLEGQSCYSIAVSQGLTLAQLESYNPNADCNLIYPTQTLCVSPLCTVGPDATCPSTPTRSPNGCTEVYEIMPGDSCWAIATKFGVTVAYLQSLNPSLDCYRIPIYPQNLLCIIGPGYPTPTPPVKTFAK